MGHWRREDRGEIGPQTRLLPGQGDVSQSWPIHPVVDKSIRGTLE